MKRFSLLVAVLFMVISGCTDGFTDINTNPNAPENVDAQFLLANALYTTANNNAVEGWENGNLLAQLTTKFDFNDIDRYDLRTNFELWRDSYFTLRDLQSVIASAEESGNNTYKGIALIMRGYVASVLTDLWVDVPYTEAIKGTAGNFTPVYDSQESIYLGDEGILASLRQGVDLLSASSALVSGDIIYGGDVDAWIKFGNALRARYLMRISARQDVSVEMNELFGGDVFAGNADNAVLPYRSTAPNQWYVFNVRSGDYNNVRMSKTIETLLKDLDDPRISVLFKPTAVSQNTGSPEFVGLENGLGPASRGGVTLNEVSTLGGIFRDVPDGVNAILMTYAELQFTFAEAAAKGIIAADAQQLYEAGIQATFDYYNIDMPADYLTRPGVAYDAANGLELIMTQKWLANFMNGYEAWYDFRRTGFPVLTPTKDNLNSNVIPSRYKYPVSEQAVNKANYDAAVSSIGEDTYNVKGWWEE